MTTPFCPWSWHGLPCAMERGHPSPHHIVAEQPQLDRVLAAVRADALPTVERLARALRVVDSGGSREWADWSSDWGFAPADAEIIRKSYRRRAAAILAALAADPEEVRP